VSSLAQGRTRAGELPTRAERSRLDRVLDRLGIDRFELGVLIALAGFSMIVFAALFTKGRALTGADGVLAADQLQYFAWVREASENVLIGNKFDFLADRHTFLHPGFLISGGVHALTGLSVPLSFQLWKPVAVVLMFTAALLYVRRLLPERGQRRVALVLVLFAVMPASAVVSVTNWGGALRQYSFDFITGEMWSGQYLWGYLMTGIAVFLMPLVLLGVERWRRERNPRTLALSALGALLVCWLQPWQGGTLALIVVAVELLRWWRAGERPDPLLVVIPIAVALPAIYYALLAAHDPSWAIASESNAAGSQNSWSWPWWIVVLTVLPLAAPAALAYRLPSKGWQEWAVRVWPFAALVVYFQPTGTFPYHSFQGLSIPLSILAVQGVASVWPRPRVWIVVTALAVLILPGTVHRIDVARQSIQAAGDPYFVFEGEQQAMDALEADPRPGGVLAPAYSGHMLPYKTGREVYVGALSWTPDWDLRVRLTQRLFEEEMPPAQARHFVRATGARFVFVDCRPGLRDLRSELRPLLEEVRPYGCATLYVLRRHPGTVLTGG
jgi:hypothetical protein